MELENGGGKWKMVEENGKWWKIYGGMVEKVSNVASLLDLTQD